MKLFRIVCTVLLFLCSSSAYAVEYSDQQDALRMLDRMERMERDLALLQRQVYNGGTVGSNMAVEATPSENTGQSGTNLARMDARIAEIEEQMRALTGKMEQVEFANTKLAEKMDKIAADNEYRFSELEKKTGGSPAVTEGEDEESKNGGATAKKHELSVADQDTASPENADDANEKPTESNPSHVLGTLPVGQGNGDDAAAEPSAPKALTPQEQYSHAFSLVRAAKYDEAVTEFTAFIEKNKKNALAGSAYYWLGEAYYAQKTYDKAAIQFLQGYKNFPKGKKAPESLLKLAISLEKLKKRKEACGTLAKLGSEYPSSSNALKQKAEEASARMGCK